MHAIRNVTEDVIWIGADDRSMPIFEGMFPIPNGVSYNSYVIRDEKIILDILRNYHPDLTDRGPEQL